jgi:hypothetical protein
MLRQINTAHKFTPRVFNFIFILLSLFWKQIKEDYKIALLSVSLSISGTVCVFLCDSVCVSAYPLTFFYAVHSELK